MTNIDSNFYKIALKGFNTKLKYLINDKTKVAFYLMEKMRMTDNTISITIEKIADELGLSYRLVQGAFKILIGEDFIRSAGPGTYMINPDIIYRGKGQKSGMLRSEYRKLEMVDKNKDYVNQRDERKAEERERRKELKAQEKSKKEINSYIKKEFKDLYN